MTINFVNGNLFDVPAQALINTVNCVGVMGKGIALEFKNRYPENFTAYKDMCDRGNLKPGTIYTHINRDILGEFPRYLINFPTKDHWRDPSRIEYITSGLPTLVTTIQQNQITSINIPPLGCGNGGLDWDVIRPIIIAHLECLKDVEINIFNTPNYVHASDSFHLTTERVILLSILNSDVHSHDDLLQSLSDIQNAGDAYFGLISEINADTAHIARILAALYSADMITNCDGGYRLSVVGENVLKKAVADDLDKSHQLLLQIRNKLNR